MKKIVSMIGMVGILHCGVNAADNPYRDQARMIGTGVIAGARAPIFVDIPLTFVDIPGRVSDACHDALQKTKGQEGWYGSPGGSGGMPTYAGMVAGEQSGCEVQ
ncbi:MAG: hypothetical protein LBD36_00415 [Holosporales bacterium]|jgi:hypothetical protein|nr:hypothetical protein [Holosporales bacterium]